MAIAESSLNLVQKHCFALGPYVTVNGETIADVRIGYETYGTLSPKRDNAVLVCHHFSGNSHCAGRYRPSDALAGYWDGIIGPGKAIDTERYFVISSDSLVNLNTVDTLSTGPASIDPREGRPYGMRFPALTPRDLVRVQKALLDSLGIRRLAAVAGPSAGAVQALQWAVEYPDSVGRVLAAIAPGLAMSAFCIGMLDAWTAPIRLDPLWQGGDYYDGEAPRRGLQRSLALVTLTSMHHGVLERGFGRKPSVDNDGRFQVQDFIDDTGGVRANDIDANAFLCMTSLLQRHDITASLERLRAPSLFVPAASDLLFPARLSEQAVETLRRRGLRSDLAIIDGDGGHLDGLYKIDQAENAIARFLAAPGAFDD